MTSKEPSPAGETASGCQQRIASTICGYPADDPIHGDIHLDRPKMSYHPFVPPEPVPTEGDNVIHVPRTPGTENTAVGPMIPKPTPEAGYPATDGHGVREVLWSKLGEGWFFTCLCGWQTNCDSSFSSAAKELQDHWKQEQEAAR